MSEMTDKPTPVEGLVADLEMIWNSVSDDKETNAAYQRVKAALSSGEKAEAGGGEAVAAVATIKQIAELLADSDEAALADKLVDAAEKLEASLSASGAVPEGYALVPVEPTEAMVNAAANYDTGSSDGTVGRFCAGEIWSLMLAAAKKEGE